MALTLVLNLVRCIYDVRLNCCFLCFPSVKCMCYILLFTYIGCSMIVAWFIAQKIQRFPTPLNFLDIKRILLLQAFDWILPLPFPDHIHCNEGSKGCWSSLSTTSTWCSEKGRPAQTAYGTFDMPPFLAQHAWSAQT